MCGIDATPAAAGPLRPSTVAKAIAFPAARCTAFQRATASSARLAGFSAVDDCSRRNGNARLADSRHTTRLADQVRLAARLDHGSAATGRSRGADRGPPAVDHPPPRHLDAGRFGRHPDVGAEDRSEEHTSELQSLAYLVCRLLLEKKSRRRSASRGPAAPPVPAQA